MVMAEKENYTPTEQDRKCKYKPMNLIFDKGGKNIHWGKELL